MPLLWFLAGCATTLLLTWAVRRRTVSGLPELPELRELDQDPADLPAAPEPTPPRILELRETRPLRELSESLGKELAILASGVEGQSQLLCETLHHPIRAGEHAEQLWETVRRLRFFSEKLQTSSTVPPLEMRPTNVGQLLANLVPEIEDYSAVSFQVSLSTAPSLPLALANADALRKAILFLIESVFDLEPNASTLLLQAQAQSNADDEVVVRVDIEADTNDGEDIWSKSTPDVLFSFVAAKNLLQAQGANIVLRHSQGMNAVASITLEATTATAQEPGGEEGTEDAHRFGGVLVMEGNATIRHMLARELHKTERNVIVCADGVAATALFDATPERFEALILEQESRRMSGEQVALRALAQKPNLKIVLITPAPGSPLDPKLRAHCHLQTIHKPFGLMELRESLARCLGPSPATVDATPSVAIESR